MLRANQEESAMPADTIVAVVLIVAVYAFFGAVLAYGDMTWNRRR